MGEENNVRIRVLEHFGVKGKWEVFQIRELDLKKMIDDFIFKKFIEGDLDERKDARD